MSSAPEQVAVPAKQPAPAKKGPAKKKTSPLRADARSKFDSSAAPMSVESFFNGFSPFKRNNVDVVMDTELPQRLSDVYVKQSKKFATAKLRAPVDNVDCQSLTYALVATTVIRKMILSAPESEEGDILELKKIFKREFFAPKALIAAVDNLGKFEHDEFIGRIRYHAQDSIRMLLQMLKVMNHHSEYTDQYDTPVSQDGISFVSWDDLDPSKIVIASQSSMRWIRDNAVSYLDRAYEHTWRAELPTGETHELIDEHGEVVNDSQGHPILVPDTVAVHVTYPRLKITGDPESQLREFLRWVGDLHQQMPRVEYLICAGLCTFWKLDWFFHELTPLSEFVPGLPAWFRLTPRDVLTQLGLNLIDVSEGAYLDGGFHRFAVRVYQDLDDYKPTFNRFLDMAKQTENAFGTPAQMLALPGSEMAPEPIIGLPAFRYNRFKAGIMSKSIVKIANKGQVVAGLIFGFTKEVKVSNMHNAHVVGDPNNLRSTWLNKDLKF